MASCKRMIPSAISMSKLRGTGSMINRIQSAISMSKLRGTGSMINRIGALANAYRPFSTDPLKNSPEGRPVDFVDAHALISTLEAQGIPSKHAEAITTAMTLVLKNVSQNSISEDDREKILVALEANLWEFKTRLHRSQHEKFFVFQSELGKLHRNIERTRAELSRELNKVTDEQYVDLLREKGRIHGELADQIAKTTNLINNLEQEIHVSKADAATKYDVLKYCIGTFLSVGLVFGMVGMLK